MHLRGADSNINAFYVCRGNCWKNPSRSPCLLAGQGGFLEQEGAGLGSVLHPCACRCCLPWAEVLCSPVLGPRGQHWGQCHPTQPGCAVSHQPPWTALHVPHRSPGCICTVTSSFLHGRATDHMKESQIWGRICSPPCCRFLHPFFIPVACHPAVSFLGWQLPVSTLRVSLQSPSSPSVFLVLFW